MQLIDRYLYAVGRYLPAKRRDDILAELRANILEMAEEREQELGRPLMLEEEEAILKQHGHPMVVAARYLPQQHLIGPAVFPFYLHTLRVVFPWVLLIYVIAQCTRFINHPVSVQAILEIVFGFVPVIFYTAAWITLVFALMEFGTSRYLSNKKVLYSWSPRKLPKPDAPEPTAPIQRTNPIFDFIASVIGLLVVIVLYGDPALIFGPVARYNPNFPLPAPVWKTVYEMAIVLISIQLVFKAFAIFSSHARAWRAVADIATKVSAIIVIAYLLGATEYVIARPGADDAVVKAMAQINYAMHLGWRFVLVILCAQLLWEIAKLLFPRIREHAKLPQLFMLK